VLDIKQLELEKYQKVDIALYYHNHLADHLVFLKFMFAVKLLRLFNSCYFVQGQCAVWVT